MTQQTKIEWTDYTVNFWEGCQKVGPGCDNCYAEARDVRFTGGTHWGPGAPRRKVKGGIQKLRMINRTAAEFKELNGHWPRVFCSSLMDFFDNTVDMAWRDEAADAIAGASGCRVQLLTKRVGNVAGMIPVSWHMQWPDHVGLMITVVNQAEADRDIPKLLDLKARLGIPWVGLSMEPLLGPVDLAKIPDQSGLEHSYMDALRGKFWMPPEHVYWPVQSSPVDGRLNVGLCPWVDWVIIGGESGPNARPMHPDWACQILAQCEAAGTPAHFKQWGQWAPVEAHEIDYYGTYIGDPKIRVTLVEGTEECGYYCSDEHGHVDHKTAKMKRVGKKAAGRLIDGRTWDGFPEALL